MHLFSPNQPTHPPTPPLLHDRAKVVRVEIEAGKLKLLQQEHAEMREWKKQEKVRKEKEEWATLTPEQRRKREEKAEKKKRKEAEKVRLKVKRG